MRDVTHLIWPESAFPFFLMREAEALSQIAELLPPGTVLITGAVRAPEPKPGASMSHAYNSIYVIDHDGSVLSVYDKVHLVPFGEYLPFQDFLERLGLQQITKVQGGFIPGDRRRALEVPRAPRFLPLICYEIIFPGEAVPRGERPGWLINVTNDGWFGISSGPYQHLQQARVRAIEEGLPLVRAANTGISAVDRSARTHRQVAAAWHRRRARLGPAAAHRPHHLRSRGRWTRQGCCSAQLSSSLFAAGCGILRILKNCSACRFTAICTSATWERCSLVMPQKFVAIENIVTSAAFAGYAE